MLSEYLNNIEHNNLPKALQTLSKDETALKAYVAILFDKSLFDKQDKVNALLDMSPKKIIRTVEKDPAYRLAMSLQAKAKELRDAMKPLATERVGLDRKYMQMQMDFQPNKRFYPDANFTLRVAYGKVDDYKPRDGVHYNYFTTLEGIQTQRWCAL